jgi:uncharacterized protein DUF6600/FecR-like protein
MKCPRIVRLGLLATSGLVFFSPAAHAQGSDYSRVVRLSRTDGQVLVSHPGSDSWEDAPANLPLQEGDTLATQGGLAEIEFENGATAYLAENSVLQFTKLDFSGGGRITQLNLTQGAATFYANLTRQDSFRVVTATFEAAIPERAEFRVDAFRDGASVQVLLGEVSVSTSAGSATFEKGQSVAIREGDLQNPNVARLPEPDSFDQWVSARSQTIQTGTKDTLNYISSPNYYGLSDLAIYGSWVNLAGYGNSWRPFRVGFSWTPYLNGHWILDPRLGWIWVSNEPWGWMPYHFGSWLLSPTLGWVWVSGGPSGLRQWQAARVNWVRAGKQVGWVAMSPNDRDGAPANLEHGVITRSGTSPRIRNASNQIVAGKDLQNVAPLKQPPAEFASRPSQAIQRSGLASTVRTIPEPSEGNETVVFDRYTHTFINGNRNNGPAAPAALLPPSGEVHAPVRTGAFSVKVEPAPKSNARTGVQQVMIPPPGPTDSPIRRVILPPAGPAPPSRMLVNRVNAPASAPSVPQSARLGGNPQSSQAATPRQASPPSSQQSRSATPPAASRTNTR